MGISKTSNNRYNIKDGSVCLKNQSSLYIDSSEILNYELLLSKKYSESL